MKLEIKLSNRTLELNPFCIEPGPITSEPIETCCYIDGVRCPEYLSEIILEGVNTLNVKRLLADKPTKRVENRLIKNFFG